MDSKKLICRHCKSDHLSIQCPNKLNKKKTTVLNLEKSLTNNIRSKYQPKLLVKFCNLPTNLQKKELVDLLNLWGPIGSVFTQYDRQSRMLTATIEFLKKSQGLKAIYQLNNTKFEHMIITVEELTTKNY